VGIKKSIHRFLLKRKLSKLENTHHSVPYGEVRHIGILFNAADQSDYVSIEAYANQLKEENKKVEILGYIPLKHIEGILSYPYFTKKEINFFQIPNSQDVQDFINKEFDVLLHFSKEEELELEYISALSKAKMRVGKYNAEKLYCYDLMIEGQNQTESIGDLIPVFNKYLKMIKNNEQ
jgi:Family of unknown function (DUF6913)